MSEFMTGLCFGTGFGCLVAVGALYVADLVWPTFSTSHKDL